MSISKIALAVALAAGTVAPADADTLSFAGRGQSINIQQLSAKQFKLESVFFDITYTPFASYPNPNTNEQTVTFSGYVGASAFRFENFSASATVSGSDREASLSTRVASTGTLMGSALEPFIGEYSLIITPMGDYSSSLGTAPTRGGVIADYAITYTYSLISAVPEPTTWGLMLAGFGMVGYAMRRRRPQAVYA